MSDNIIQFPLPDRDTKNPPYELVVHADNLSKLYGDELKGFFIVTVGEGGFVRSAYRVPEGMGGNFFVALVSESVRREIISVAEARDAVADALNPKHDDGA